MGVWDRMTGHSWPADKGACYIQPGRADATMIVRDQSNVSHPTLKCFFFFERESFKKKRKRKDIEYFQLRRVE